MHKRWTRSAARTLAGGLILALLVLVSGFSSALTQGIDVHFFQEAKLTASDGSAWDYFGRSVSISGDTVVVGAYGHDDAGHYSGAAYLFERDEGGPGNWGQVAKLTASDGAEGDIFGGSVSISSDTVVVGAYGDDDNGYNSGAVYLFERPGTGWTNMTETAKLTASDGAEGDVFGLSVSISGNAAVAGAPQDDDKGEDSGSAYLFERDEGGPGNWGQVAKLTASDGAAGDIFGDSVSISGDTVVAGARLDGDSGDSSGSAYLFEKPHSGWTDMMETAKLTASDGAAEDEFGSSVSISGDTLVAGAPGDDDNGESSGSAYLFERPVAGWPASMTETAKLIASDGAQGDLFGHSVSISGDTVVAGAHYDDDSAHKAGSAYLFVRPETGWAGTSETDKITAADGAEYDQFGYSVSVSGDAVVAGAPQDDDKGDASGSAYLFSRFRPVTWVYLPVVARSAP